MFSAELLCRKKACILNSELKRLVRKFRTATVHPHSFCPLSPVLCLFIVKSQTSLLPMLFVYLCLFIFFLLSLRLSVSLILSLRVHTVPVFLALALPAQNLRAGSLVVLWECNTHTHTHTFIHTQARLIFHCLSRYNVSQSVCVCFCWEGRIVHRLLCHTWE